MLIRHQMQFYAAGSIENRSLNVHCLHVRFQFVVEE